MFKNEHELFVPVLFDSCFCYDSCLRYDSCQPFFRWAAVCYEQITLLSVKGENQPETLIGFDAKRVETSSNSQFPACFLWKKLCSLTSVTQSSEQWQTRLTQQCPGCVGAPKTPDVTYAGPVLLMDPSHHLCASSQQVRGRCPQQCVHLDSSPGRFRSWRDFS